MTDKEKKHAWYLAHADEVKARAKQWAIDNPERTAELNKRKSKRYEEANRVKRREKSKRYYSENKDKAKKANREYFLKHRRDKYPMYSRKRLYGITQEQFEAVLYE